MILPKNILVLATPRTGSTTLLKVLSHDMKIYPELLVGNNTPETND